MKFIAPAIGLAVVLPLAVSVQAQIYESKGDDGAPVFSDTPSPGSEEVTLKQENIADSVEPVDRPEPPKKSAGEGGKRKQIVIVGEQESPSNPQYIVTEDWDDDRRPHLGPEQRREIREALPRDKVGDSQPRDNVGEANPHREVRQAAPRRSR